MTRCAGSAPLLHASAPSLLLLAASPRVHSANSLVLALVLSLVLSPAGPVPPKGRGGASRPDSGGV